MFTDGSDFDRIFETSGSPIRVFSEVHTDGSDLLLDEVVIYPVGDAAASPSQPRVSELLELFRAIRLLAREAGFDRLIATWHRIGTHRDERIIVHTRSLQ